MTSVVELFKEKGFQEGRLEELRHSIARLLSKGLSPEEVSGLIDADLSLVPRSWPLCPAET